MDVPPPGQPAADRRPSGFAIRASSLSLNDSVHKWLPGVIVGHGYHPARITIRELLPHISGIRDYMSGRRSSASC